MLVTLVSPNLCLSFHRKCCNRHLTHCSFPYSIAFSRLGYSGFESVVSCSSSFVGVNSSACPYSMNHFALNDESNMLRSSNAVVATVDVVSDDDDDNVGCF